jgi:hypothetical protein
VATGADRVYDSFLSDIEFRERGVKSHWDLPQHILMGGAEATI